MTVTSILLMLFVFLAFAYIVYLRIQLYINHRILDAFQQAAVVVPPSKGKSDVRLGFMGVGMLILAVAVLALGIVR